MKRILPALLMLLALPAHAEIFKWVDDQGRTHFGEAPPAKYRNSATAISTTPLNTIQGGVLGKRSDSGKAASPPAAGDAAPTPAPPEPSAADQCALEHERFYLSQACFARYRNANGSLRAEASTQCENVAQPTCALQR